uniref:GDP-D-mannose dehydratase n=1 Tax=Oncorhynchus tshawytscha TaxID=74940 RepID=A0AAZ3SM69_ONCTS
IETNLCVSTKMCGLTKSVKSTPFYPRSPFGNNTCACTHNTEAYNLFAVNGILIIHSNFLQWVNFVTRKISRSVAKVHLGQLESISLGSLHSKRDWDHAKDYAEEEEPEDLAIATGEVRSVREFVEKSSGQNHCWEGKDENEVGHCQETAVVNMNVDPKYYRPTEVPIDFQSLRQRLLAIALALVSNFLQTARRDIKMSSTSSSDSGDVDKGPQCQNPEVSL